MTLDKELLEILACPQCKGDMKVAKSGDWLVCGGCGLKYPIKDGIPVLLVEEAEKTGSGS